MGTMSKRDSEDFAQSEVACMRASLHNLLSRYVRPGSTLAIALSNADVELDKAETAVHEPGSYRPKPRGRYAAGG